MLPSDHFVRFYNEVFKFLEAQGTGHLEKYWLEISRHQEQHCLENFKKNGLQGMYDYWEHIRIEENCDMTLDLSDDCFNLKMNKCPSLGKVMDSDAAPSLRYCEHCTGWIVPLIHKAGYYCVTASGEPDVPTCESWIYADKVKAQIKIQELKNKGIEFKSNID